MLDGQTLFGSDAGDAVHVGSSGVAGSEFVFLARTASLRRHWLGFSFQGGLLTRKWGES
jgi:hypothetical protein